MLFQRPQIGKSPIGTPLESYTFGAQDAPPPPPQLMPPCYGTKQANLSAIQANQRLIKSNEGAIQANQCAIQANHSVLLASVILFHFTHFGGLISVVHFLVLSFSTCQNKGTSNKGHGESPYKAANGKIKNSYISSQPETFDLATEIEIKCQYRDL